MTENEILEECRRIEADLAERGFTRARCSAYIHWLGEETSVVVGSDEIGNNYFNAETMAYAFAAARAHLSKIKSSAQVRRENALRNLGRLIDEFREVGIEADFLNPLEQMMKKLSENILEHKP